MSSSSNNTNKHSPQEHHLAIESKVYVQIIQINIVLKNGLCAIFGLCTVQIIQINIVLKNIL